MDVPIKEEEPSTADEASIQLEKAHEEFEVLAGVAGITGAGKSTVLNMLLVAFRTQEDVQRELELIYETLDECRKMEEVSADDEEEWFKQQAENTPTIKDGLQKILAVWGKEREEVEKLSAEDLLASNEDVLSVLGTTKRFYAADKERFAEMIKPYLDSSMTTEG
ncbi:hypothetical protein B0T09DRAFT_383408 [Sordaria sp. MPI-SDFR-AT-0083]|nr:hypothetical protein B0T09DRAFT_383408 [Sordaria sp. MPI-SDFR-AT-0083]